MLAADLFNPAWQEVFRLHYDAAGNFAPVATLQGRATAGFHHTRAGQPGYKLYVVGNAEGVQYVGCTRTSFAQRLRLGHARRRQARHGYHGYKWLTRPDLLLHVFPLDDQVLTELTGSDDGPSARQLAEGIEAELVYYLRLVWGQWPLGQHEIHFHALPQHPALRRLATEVARAIFQELPPLPPAA